MMGSARSVTMGPLHGIRQNADVEGIEANKAVAAANEVEDDENFILTECMFFGNNKVNS